MNPGVLTAGVLIPKVRDRAIHHLPGCAIARSTTIGSPESPGERPRACPQTRGRPASGCAAGLPRHGATEAGSER